MRILTKLARCVVLPQPFFPFRCFSNPGKTLLARAIAGEAGVPFFSATGADFEQMFIGVGAKRMRELFAEAKKVKPAIIFIDEIDTVGGKRNDFDHPKARMSLNQLLTELDGFSENSGVIVIAATNYAETLDPALLRPGRFDRHVSVPVPDIKGRREVRTHTHKRTHCANARAESGVALVSLCFASKSGVRLGRPAAVPRPPIAAACSLFLFAHLCACALVPDPRSLREEAETGAHRRPGRYRAQHCGHDRRGPGAPAQLLGTARECPG